MVRKTTRKSSSRKKDYASSKSRPKRCVPSGNSLKTKSEICESKSRSYKVHLKSA